MKSDRVSGTPNQIPPTDEIMPDLNHSGIYNTQNRQKTLCVIICIWILWCENVRQRTKLTKRRRTQTSISRKKKHSSKLMCTVVFVKESDTSLWRCQAKLIFKWSKATEPSETKTWCRHNANQHVWPLTCHLSNHSQTALLYFFWKTSCETK